MTRRIRMFGGFLLLAAGVAALAASPQSQPASGPEANPPPADGAPVLTGGPLTAAPLASGPATASPASKPAPGSQPAGGLTASSQPASRPAAPRPAPRYGQDYGSSSRSRSGRNRSDRVQPAEATAPPVFGPGTSWNDFSAVADRNIFVKERSSRPSRSNSAGSFGASSPSSVGLVLTGLSLEDSRKENVSKWVALFDDPQTGRMARASAGQVIDGGKIVAVSIDGVDYEKNGQCRRIGLGQTLAGGRIDLANLPTATSQDASTAASAPSGDGGEDSVLERMKRRRQEEMK